MKPVEKQTPTKVRSAVALLWASLFLSTVEFMAEGAPFDDGLDWTLSAIFVTLTGAYGYIVSRVSRGANWARIVVLVLTAAFVVMSIVWPPEIGAQSWWSTLLMVVSGVADVVAVFLLFSSASHAWFKNKTA